MFVRRELEKIEQKVLNEERLTRRDGEKLFACNELSWLGALADYVRKKKCGNIVYYNVNCHVNLTNICVSRCKFCAFGRNADDRGAYAMTIKDAIKLVKKANKDPHLSGLHIVSGLHPTWTFDDYLSFVEVLHEKFPHLHIKGFTGVEIQHFANISGLSIEKVLFYLKAAGLEMLAGGGAEILTNRVRNLLCPRKATATQWLKVAETAHRLGISTNASMLYGHIETFAERIEHLIKLRKLQDKTGGFQAFIPFPFLPKNTMLENKIKKASMRDDLRTMAISRLMLDNFTNIKAYWVMLTIPVAQVALNFGANDFDGTIYRENILHEAGATSPRSLTEEELKETIVESGRLPAAVDCNFNIRGMDE